MSRAVRTARGAVGAAIATVFAAASHALAGGTITPLALVATALVALPLCVALAGRTGSFWRLCLAVTASQFLYHWSFSELGLSAGGGAPTGGAHAAHRALLAFSPELTASSAADAWMWAAHAGAAALTILLMHRGERAALDLIAVVRRALVSLPGQPTAAILLAPARLAVPSVLDPLHERLMGLSAISHRGPPASILTPDR